jgi:hypothetical protein
MITGIVAIVLLASGSLTEFGVVAMPIADGVVLIYFGLRPRKDNCND